MADGTSNTLILKPGKLTLSDLHRILEDNCDLRFSVDREIKPAIDENAKLVETAIAKNKPIYGINTGFGKLASTQISKEDLATLQRNLILSHCCGVGEPLPENVVRLIMILKMMSLGRGASGVRWDLIELLENMCLKNVIPVIPKKGSVGASGDLAPLAHVAAVMIGEGQATLNGETLTGAEALNRAGLKPIELGPKEGLAMINGTQVSTALAVMALFRAWRSAQTALVTGALSTDADMGSSEPFHPQIHELRGHQGQIEAAHALRMLMKGSEIRESHREDDKRVQDPYCIRCQPQVMGAALDLMRQTAKTLLIEANAVTDNPLVLSDGKIVSGGNFHAEPVAFAADQIALAIAEIGSIAQRRIALLVDPTLNFGLPAFLTPKPGLHSGFMIAEVTSAALMSENKQKSHPASVDSIPTSANQEDHVSMACHGARRLLDMVENLNHILGIEALCAVQGIEFRAPLTTSDRLSKVVLKMREHVTRLEEDRYLAPDLDIASQLVEDASLIKAAGLDILPSIIN